MGKEKKQVNGDVEEGEASGKSWEEKIAYLSPISKPLASRKLTKKIYKTVKKAYKLKQLDIGLLNVQKSIRKGGRGLLVMAGDINNIDLFCHLPLLCEESGIPYCFVPSKADLGGALGQQRHASMMMIKPHEEFQESYDEVVTSVQQLPSPL